MTTDVVIETENDEYDDYQHEVSNDLANDFVEEEIFPLLEEFDFNNENSDYIPGIASFCLFAKLSIKLIGEGYTIDELKSIIDDFSIYCVDDIVH